MYRLQICYPMPRRKGFDVISERFNEPYVIDGDTLYFRSSKGLTRVCSTDETFALGYDAQDAVLLKHGQAESVAEYMHVLSVSFAQSPMPELAEGLMLVSFKIAPETIEEVNACIQVSNRVGHIIERLDQLGHGDIGGPTLH